MEQYYCPVCGTPFNPGLPHPDEECKCCGWAFDCYQYDHHDAKRCINIMSVNECREAWKNGKEFFQNIILKKIGQTQLNGLSNFLYINEKLKGYYEKNNGLYKLSIQIQLTSY